MYYGYKHWTMEETPRCFYVGKGKKYRPYEVGLRSKKWRAVSERYGLCVEVCLGPVSDQEAIAWEISSIAKEDTFTRCYSTEGGANIRCNFTRGGDGASGYKHTEEFKRSISLRCKGKPGKPHTEEEKQRMRANAARTHRFAPHMKARKPVQQLDKQGNVIADFGSLAEARNSTGASCAAISLHCQGRRQLQLWRFKPAERS